MLHDVEVTRLNAIDHGAAEVTVTGQITCDMAGGSGLDGALGPSAAVLAPVLSQASAAAPSAGVLAPRPLPALRRRPIPAVVVAPPGIRRAPGRPRPLVASLAVPGLPTRRRRRRRGGRAPTSPAFGAARRLSRVSRRLQVTEFCYYEIFNQIRYV